MCCGGVQYSAGGGYFQIRFEFKYCSTVGGQCCVVQRGRRMHGEDVRDYLSGHDILVLHTNVEFFY